MQSCINVWCFVQKEIRLNPKNRNLLDLNYIWYKNCLGMTFFFFLFNSKMDIWQNLFLHSCLIKNAKNSSNVTLPRSMICNEKECLTFQVSKRCTLDLQGQNVLPFHSFPLVFMKDCKLSLKSIFMYFWVNLTATFRHIWYILKFVHTLNSLLKSVLYFFCIPYIFYLVSSLLVINLMYCDCFLCINLNQRSLIWKLPYLINIRERVDVRSVTSFERYVQMVTCVIKPTQSTVEKVLLKKKKRTSP